MKKKVFRVLSLLMAVALLCLPMVGCGGGKDAAHAGKEEILISYYTGEFGDDWIKNLAEQWNATNDKYYVNAKGNLNLSGVVIADIKSGTKNDIIITEDCNFGTIFDGNYLESLNDLLSATPAGESGTIGDKIMNKDTWMEMATKNGVTYMVPYNISPTGLIFDYERFAQNGWLFDKDGKLGGSNGVHPGKDGVEGTYDDGQPQNMDQFKAMCEKIRNSGTEVFLYMGAKHPEYVSNVAYAYLAQYLGEEGFRAFYQHDSQGAEVELYDGRKTVITIENGYESMLMKGVEKMGQFLSEYLGNRNYVSEATLHDVALTVDASHTQFLTAGGPAFIVEGNWFENGSRQLIESMQNYDPDAKAYGEADYRYMLVPASTEGKSVIHSQTGGSILVVKQENEEKRAAIMDFLSFMLSDSSMGQVAQQTGMLWNYNYKLSQEHMNGMTKFTRNAYDLLQDTQNVTVRSAFIDTASVPVHAYSAMGASYMTYNLSTQQEPLPALISNAGGDVQKFMQEIAAYNTADRWATWLNQAKSYGYYS